VTADQLLSGRDDDRPHRLRAVVLLALVVVVGLALVAARWESRRQLDALLAAATEVERVVHDSRVSLGGMVQYSNGLLARSDLEPAQRAAVVDSMVVDAQRFPPRVAAARAEVERVRPLPWDDDLRAAREAYLARIDVWTGFVTGAVDLPESLLYERRETRPARLAAAEALAAAAGERGQGLVEQLTDDPFTRRR
jgi:hypothetical protein